MLTKKTAKNETRTNAAAPSPTASNPSIRDSIAVQDHPDQTRDAKTQFTSTNDKNKNFHPNTPTPPAVEGFILRKLS
jgi:hypothetical protein